MALFLSLNLWRGSYFTSAFVCINITIWSAECIGGILRRGLESAKFGKCLCTVKNEKWEESHPKQSETELIAFVWKYYLCSFLATGDITIVGILFSIRIPTFTELIKVFIKVKWGNLGQNLFGIQKLKHIRGSIVRTAKNAFLKKS